MDVTKFPLDERTQKRLNKIRDPLQRVVKAHALAVEARHQVVGTPRKRNSAEEGEPSALLVMRNEVLLELHRRDPRGWSINACARWVEVDRRTISLPNGFSALPASRSAELAAMTEEELKERAKDLQEEWEDWASVWRTATEIRDALVIQLTTRSGDTPPAFQNAELARAAAMSSSLVAQIRKDSKNKWKKANREIFRANRRNREKLRKLGAVAGNADPSAA